MAFRQILLGILLTISPLIIFASDYYIATSDLNVRSGAGKKYPLYFTIEKGESVEVLSKNGSWYKIKYLERMGFAHSKYLKSISNINVNPSKQSYANNSSSGILLIFGAIVFVWLLPILIIIGSSKTTSGEKVAWILAVLFISWFAWIFYMLLAPLKTKQAS